MKARRAHILVGELFKECRTSGVDCIVLIGCEDVCSVQCFPSDFDFNGPYIRQSIALLKDRIDRESLEQRTSSAHVADNKLDEIPVSASHE